MTTVDGVDDAAGMRVPAGQPAGTPVGVFDAVVLAGGSARRLGGTDKPALTIGGVSLLDRVLDAVTGAGRTAVVGPSRPGGRAGVEWCLEDPPGGGPVAAIAAGLRHTSADVVVVLAADLPGVAPAVPVLRAALRDSDRPIGGRADVAVLVDASGRINHLAAAWDRHALERALARIGEPDGAPARRLLDGSVVARVLDPAGWGRDCDTWADLAAAREGVL